MLKINIDGITADELIKMALIGLEQQHKEQSERINALMAHLKGKSKPVQAATVKKSHRLCPEARARIIAGQKKRWDRVKREQKQATQLDQAKPAPRRGRPPKPAIAAA